MYDIRLSTVLTDKVDECAFLFIVDFVSVSDHNLDVIATAAAVDGAFHRRAEMPEYNGSQENCHIVSINIIPYLGDPVPCDANSRMFGEAEETTEAGRNVIPPQLDHFDPMRLFLQYPKNPFFKIFRQPSFGVFIEDKNCVHGYELDDRDKIFFWARARPNL